MLCQVLFPRKTDSCIKTLYKETCIVDGFVVNGIIVATQIAVACKSARTVGGVAFERRSMRLRVFPTISNF